jgi:pimeloyl-ACP methyl ester carboxylesterase
MSSKKLHDIKALWFGREVSLLGHLHIPGGTSYDLAAVICAAPFGYENICAHRCLRILGDRLAESGIAALRYDAPGTGDSDGEQGLQAWKNAVADAVATARQETGCTRVAVIGVGLGGTIALGAIDNGLDVDKLILWSAPLTGRTWLRQQRAYQRVTAVKPNPNDPPPPPSSEGIEELSGFPLSTQLADELTALDVSQMVDLAHWPANRARPVALVISRSPGDTSSRLVESLVARDVSATSEDHSGFDLMFDEPHLSIAPAEIFARMRDWLKEGIADRATYPASNYIDKEVATRIGKDGLVEERARYSQGDGGVLFSIETRPIDRDPYPTWLILLTGRAVRHIGPNRIWVRFARQLAKEGYASLRLDGRSVGDSEGEGDGLMPNKEYYQEHIYDDIERVMEIAVAKGAKRFLMTGICSGATASYQIAWRRSDVCAIVMLNPLQLRHDPEDDERQRVEVAKKWRPRSGIWTDPKAYLRALKGDFPLRRVLEIAFLRAKDALSFRRKANEPSYVFTGFHTLSEKPVEIDIFLSGDDVNSTAFLERHFGKGLANFNRERLRLLRVPNADHTIRPVFAQERFYGLLHTALERVSKQLS